MADFQFFRHFIFMNGSAKSSAVQWVVRFFEGLNFTNEQYPQKSRNLRTSKKPTIRYFNGTLARNAYYLVWSKWGAYILMPYVIMRYVHLSSCIYYFHKYQAIWEPRHGEELKKSIIPMTLMLCNEGKRDPRLHSS